MKKTKEAVIPQETIESKIFSIRGKRVMLDRDLLFFRVLKQGF
jgi:hypothetical protein